MLFLTSPFSSSWHLLQSAEVSGCLEFSSQKMSGSAFLATFVPCDFKSEIYTSCDFFLPSLLLVVVFQTVFIVLELINHLARKFYTCKMANGHFPRLKIHPKQIKRQRFNDSLYFENIYIVLLNHERHFHKFNHKKHRKQSKFILLDDATIKAGTLDRGLSRPHISL